MKSSRDTELLLTILGEFRGQLITVIILIVQLSFSTRRIAALERELRRTAERTAARMEEST